MWIECYYITIYVRLNTFSLTSRILRRGACSKMSMKKHVITSLLVGGLISTSAVPTYATGNDSLEDSVHGSSLSSGVLDINNPDQNTVISDVLTFDEIVEEISDEQGISEKEAASHVLDATTSPAPNKSLKSFRNLSGVAASSQAVTAAKTFRTITTSFKVKSNYIPALKFYCQTTEGGSFRAIKKIMNVGMNRFHLGKEDGLSKGFSGNVFTNLEDPNRIYWIINGDFYNNNSVTTEGAVDLGLHQTASINFSVASTTSHFAYTYLTGYTYF